MGFRGSLINNQADIDTLLKEYFNFHDACVCSINYMSGAAVDEDGSMGGTQENCSLTVRFESQMPAYHKQPEKKSLELKFTGLRRLNLIGYEEDYFSGISSCYLSFYKDFIVWSDSDCFDPENFCGTPLFSAGSMATFIVADRLEWRFV